MSKLLATPESPELIQLRQQAQQTEIKERQTLLKEFLGNVKKMIKDQAALHLPKTVEETQRSRIIQPQVFLSYAWEAASTPKLAHLHTFLKQLASDLTAAGLTPWLDIQRMTGDLDEQMRLGIQDSQYALLIGTNRYAERTKPDSNTNVRKELDFTLAEAKKSSDFLLPLMLEGDYGTTFPTVGTFLIRDCRSWYSLEQGQWQSQENYIKELTQSEPLGVLPCLLGLNRRERQWIKYRQACVKQYGQLQQALMNTLELLKKRQEEKDTKSSPSHPSRPAIQLTPILQIPFNALEYDKKSDKIGSGSYGEVYRGWWQGKQPVAIKELTGSLTTDAEKDLYREAGIMAYVAKESKEPYPVVRLFGLAVAKPDYALVMEYVPNGTLFDLLQSQSEAKLPWDLRYQLAIDIADGIALLHRQHILHRDLRSHNILLNIVEGRLRVKLSDFGLSTVKSSVRTHSTVIKKTESVGTLAWMAPELHKRGGQSSTASDIYSYGMVLWELLTHATPFADAQGNTDLISKWVVTDRETETIPGDCPPQLAELIKKCWAFKPEDRILMDGIQKELAVLVKVYEFSPETRVIIETLKKSQEERETKWNARWQGRDAEQKQKEELHEIEIKKQAEIDKLQQQHQAEQLALQKKMRELDELQSAKLAAVEEEKRRIEQEKQQKEKEIERLKQQHQENLKHAQEDQKRQTPFPVQSPKSTPPLPPVSQIIPQTILLEPTTQLALQDQLIAACKQGDEKAVKALLQQGAKPNMANVKGEQPLGAAVWGMCPDVVNTLLKQADGVAPMTWDECEKHNLRHYEEVFIVSKFDPQTYREWYQLLLKIDLNPFICAFHLKKVNEKMLQDVSWGQIKVWLIKKSVWHVGADGNVTAIPTCDETEKELISYRTQIKQGIESAKRPTAKADTLQQHHADFELPEKDLKYESSVQSPKSTLLVSQIIPQTVLPEPTAQLVLQNQLIAACNQGQQQSSRQPAGDQLENELKAKIARMKLRKPIPQTVMIPPKPKASPEQLALQNKLIAACKQGDEKTVKALLQQGAHPDMVNAEGEHPLGAAVWGMCPHVVNILLTAAGEIALMTWEECGKHNLKYYKEVFIIPKFDPQTFGEWNDLLQKMDTNPFVRAFHLKKVDEQWHDGDSASWDDLKAYVRRRVREYGAEGSRIDIGRYSSFGSATEMGFVNFRTQIKQWIESAKKPLPQEQHSARLAATEQEKRRLIAEKDEKAFNQLLQYVAEGEQDKAEELIKQDKNLLLHTGTVKDLSGREFKQIMAFQYALWAMDYHMWTMIQKYLPKESQAEQLQTLESKGTAHGNHFSLKELTDALQVYVDNAEKVWRYDQRARDHWCNES